MLQHPQSRSANADIRLNMMHGLPVFAAIKHRHVQMRKKSNMMLNLDLLNLILLAGWTSEDVWNYIRENNVIYNPLHDQQLSKYRM